MKTQHSLNKLIKLKQQQQQMFELGKVFFLTKEQIKEEKQFATAFKSLYPWRVYLEHFVIPSLW